MVCRFRSNRLPLGAALVGLGTQNASFYDDLLIR
ncbi:hypothetical protein LEMLEM_LOCUS1729 [Lemmus lemmus]